MQTYRTRRTGRGWASIKFTSAQTQSLLASIDRRTDLSDYQKNAMKDTIRETAVVSQNGNRFTKNLVRNNRVQGAEYNDQALLNYSTASSRHLAAAATSQPKVNAALDRMKQVMDDRKGDGSGSERSRVYNEVMSRSNAKTENMYPQSSAAMQHIQNLAFIQDMASASHLLTHQLNMHYMGGSVIGSRHGIMGRCLKGSTRSCVRRAGRGWRLSKASAPLQ